MTPEIIVRQVTRWDEHARAAGHNLETAKYDRSPMWSHIECCECDWEYEDEEAKAAIAEAKEA